LIEAVSGQRYDEFMTQQVLHPLGLYNTFTNPRNAHETGRVIGGNRLGFLRPRPHNPPVSLPVVPTGYIYSSISDMARWAGIHLGEMEVSGQFARVVQRSHQHNHASTNPFIDENDFYAAGWFVNSEYGYIRHGGLTPGYTAMVSIFTNSNRAIVILSNLSYNTIGQFENLVLNAMDDDIFNRVSMDFNAIMDIVLTILVVLGVIFTLMFVLLVIKGIKKYVAGERIKMSFGIKDILRLAGGVLSVVVLVAFYTVPQMIFESSREVVVIFGPSSISLAGIALWMMVVYFWFYWLFKMFGSAK
ncbi:MAG: beta-lactamase family protein, partial [Defluviitaleaceae bacterium]|nr:beta-lactamase family protein [Defluviitaleaceae bacterium]